MKTEQEKVILLNNYKILSERETCTIICCTFENQPVAIKLYEFTSTDIESLLNEICFPHKHPCLCTINKYLVGRLSKINETQQELTLFEDANENLFDPNPLYAALVFPCATSSLEDFLERHYDDAFLERKYILSQIIDGMKALHENRFVHGDLKPSNVLIFRNPQNLSFIQAQICDIASVCKLPRCKQWMPIDASFMSAQFVPLEYVLDEAPYVTVERDIFALGMIGLSFYVPEILEWFYVLKILYNSMSVLSEKATEEILQLDWLYIFGIIDSQLGSKSSLGDLHATNEYKMYKEKLDYYIKTWKEKVVAYKDDELFDTCLGIVTSSRQKRQECLEKLEKICTHTLPLLNNDSQVDIILPKIKMRLPKNRKGRYRLNTKQEGKRLTRKQQKLVAIVSYNIWRKLPSTLTYFDMVVATNKLVASVLYGFPLPIVPWQGIELLKYQTVPFGQHVYDLKKKVLIRRKVAIQTKKDNKEKSLAKTQQDGKARIEK